VTRSLVVFALLGALGCTEGLRGVPMKAPAATGVVVASATTAEREGLEVLWNGQTSGGDFEWKTWIAGSPEELDAVWSAAAAGSAPPVDFSRYVVIAAAGGGGVCTPRVTGIDAEASGLLTLRFDPDTIGKPCILLLTRVARIVAIPRRVLPATVVFMNGYAFAVPEVPFG